MDESRSCHRFKSLKKCTWSDSDFKSESNSTDGSRSCHKSLKKCCKCTWSDSDFKYESNSDDHAKKKMKPNSNSTNTCSVVSNLPLLEDLMLDIFTLVPLYCLINSARYVSKSWATTIGSFYFVEASERLAKPGLFVQNLADSSRSYFLDIKDDVNGQFEITPLGTPPTMGYICYSCDGMLLLRNHRQHFAVNPILKCSFRIPPLRVEVLCVHNFITIARVPHTTKFKLFHIDVPYSNGYWFVFYVLRIGVDNSWKEIIRKKAPSHCTAICYDQPVKGAGNALYWILSDSVAMMDIDKEIIVREYPLPPILVNDLLHRKYIFMGNHLSCIVYNSPTTHQLYILNFDLGEWSLYCDLGPFDFVAACGHKIRISFISFSCWINNQIIITVTLREKRDPKRKQFIFNKTMHFGYNLKTKQLTEIKGVAEGYYDVCAHTNSLISLPCTPT